MIKVDFDPRELTGDDKSWWDAWLDRARQATKAIIQRWEQEKKIVAGDFDDSIWSDLKHWMLQKVFRGKCAYCETHIGMARQPGHAEHFRPKGGIRNRVAGQEKLVGATARTPDGVVIDHPGYFWLAYYWNNLLPCCHACNTGRGKNNQFPTGKGHLFIKELSKKDVSKLKGKWVFESVNDPGWYYLASEDLDDEEERLLLHPYYDNPGEHLVFGHKGIEAPRHIAGAPSAKAVASIDTYELGDDNLRRARQNAQQRAVGMVLTTFNSALIVDGKSPEEARKEADATLNRILNDANNPTYCAAVKDFVEHTLGRSR